MVRVRVIMRDLLCVVQRAAVQSVAMALPFAEERSDTNPVP